MAKTYFKHCHTNEDYKWNYGWALYNLEFKYLSFNRPWKSTLSCGWPDVIYWVGSWSIGDEYSKAPLARVFQIIAKNA